MRAIAAALAFSVIAICSSCTKRTALTEPAGPPFVAAFEKESDVAYFHCEDEGCLKARETDCQPAHLHRAFTTVEGSKVFLDTYVRPRDGGCEAVLFSDYSLDYWGHCKVGKSVCPSTANFKDRGWDAEHCTASILYRAPVCDNPYD